jgi:hypothetical protein
VCCEVLTVFGWDPPDHTHMDLFRMVYVFTPKVMIYFGLLLPDRSSLYPLALVVIDVSNSRTQGTTTP